MKVIPIRDKVFVHAEIIGYDLTSNMFVVDLNGTIISQDWIMIPGDLITKLKEHSYIVPKDFIYIQHHHYKDLKGTIYSLDRSFHTNGNAEIMDNNTRTTFYEVQNISEYWRYVDTHISLTLEFNYAIDGTEMYSVFCLEYNLDLKIHRNIYQAL